MSGVRSLIVIIAAAISIATAGVMAVPGSALGYTHGVHIASYSEKQHTSCWCVVAAAQVWLRYLPNSTVPSQTTIDGFMKSPQKNRYPWTLDTFRDYIRCTQADSGYPSPTYANDSLGMAWAMYNYSAAGYGFRDYWSFSRSAMNWRIILGIRSTGDPVAATVMAGAHEVLVVGYSTQFDPADYAYGDNTINGFRIWDPWHDPDGVPFTGFSGWPFNGYDGNQYITRADWNLNVYLEDQNEGPYYDEKYVAVLRSVSSSNPTYQNAQDPSGGNDPTFQSYGTWWFQQQQGLAAQGLQGLSDVDDLESPTEAESLAAAVDVGLTDNDLFGDQFLGQIAPDYQLGRSVRVESLVSGTPSYHLVEIRVGTTTRAIALVNEGSSGYWFGSLIGIEQGTRLPSQAMFNDRVAAAGLSGPVRLVWGHTLEGAPRNFPFLVGTDPSGRPSFADRFPITPAFTLN